MESTLKLSVADRAMLWVSRALGDMGFPGFQVQLLAWLSGRVDARRLRTAIARFAQAHPVICSRLDDADQRPCWRYHPRVDELLQETNLASAHEQAVVDEAGRLLSVPSDLTQQNPVCFHLLHRPDGRDVLLLQFDHVLMDNNAGLPVLREINRLAQMDPSLSAEPPIEGRDWGRWYLRKLPWQRRKQAVVSAMGEWRKTFKNVCMIGRVAQPAPGPGQLRLVMRSFSDEQTQAIQARVTDKCGLPSLSMALLASAFRGIARFSPQKFPSASRLVAGLGLDLGLRTKQGALCQNAASLISVHVSSEGISDQAELIRTLSQRFRDFLAGDGDIAMMQLVSHLTRKPELAQRVTEFLLKLANSLWYGYFGNLDLPGETFCDVPLENVHFFGPSWSPMGLTLLANQFRGRLLLQATYVPASLSEASVNQFLDFVMADLASL